MFSTPFSDKLTVVTCSDIYAPVNLYGVILELILLIFPQRIHSEHLFNVLYTSLLSFIHPTLAWDVLMAASPGKMSKLLACGAGMVETELRRTG